MITCQEKALDQMRLGLFDVLPAGSLDALTAEDFRLLLNGVSLNKIVGLYPRMKVFFHTLYFYWFIDNKYIFV